MSTEHQRYSLLNQQVAIAAYAVRRGFDIVATYADAGKSGLSLKGRKALKQLLSDAMSPNRKFDAILVLDVSRWGRFQDTDEAAHYEFVCRQAGVTVAYCDEPFENDISMTASILKNLKRVMAAEYSRELSAKTARAHRQQAGLGFNQGGTLVYGFRRELRDRDGCTRLVLKQGEKKAISSDRVVVVPGPSEELNVIRRIFRMHVRQKMGLRDIAERLRNEGIPAAGGKSWQARSVRTVLASEFCIGRYTYNRVSHILQGPRTSNPETLWVRTPTMKAIVSEKIFFQAQTRLSVRRGMIPYSEESLLQGLRDLLKKEGRLSRMLVKHSAETRSLGTFYRRFGDLHTAYKLIGYESPVGPGRYPHVWTDEALIAGIKKVHEKYGFLSNTLVEESQYLPSPNYLRKRFGSLNGALAFAELPTMTHSELTFAAHRRLRERAYLRDPDRSRFRPNGTFIMPRFSSAAVLEGLARLLQAKGYLSGDLIDSDPDLPSAATVCNRFGSLLRAYEMVGWKRTQSQIYAEMHRRRHAELV